MESNFRVFSFIFRHTTFFVLCTLVSSIIEVDGVFTATGLQAQKRAEELRKKAEKARACCFNVGFRCVRATRATKNLQKMTVINKEATKNPTNLTCQFSFDDLFGATFDDTYFEWYRIDYQPYHSSVVVGVQFVPMTFWRVHANTHLLCLSWYPFKIPFQLHVWSGNMLCFQK